MPSKTGGRAGKSGPTQAAPSRSPRAKASHSVPAEWIRNKSDELAAAKGYTFDVTRGDRVIKFLETFCRQSKGEWAGKPLKVLDWQADFIRRLYGWRTPEGLRRFKRAYLEVPKKNGKSTLLSGLALYELVAGDAGPEVYVNAFDRSQAGIIYDESEKMVEASPALAKLLEPVSSRKTITHPKAQGKLQALSADVPSKDGMNPSLVLFDELHRQRSWAMWDIFRFAGVARLEPLTISITTAGVDRHSVCYAEHKHAEEVNSGVSEDLRFLGIIYGATIKDDFRDPEVWKRANPSIGHTLRIEDFAEELKEVEGKPAALNNWLRLRLNIWTQATTSYINPERWDACEGEPYKPEDLYTCDAWGGLDLASTDDLAAFVCLVDYDGELRVACRFYCPESAVERRSQYDGVPYLDWVKAGFLIATPGERIDHGFIRADILNFASRHNLIRLYSDPWNAIQLCGELIEAGLTVEFIDQRTTTMNEPTKTLESWVMAGAINHGGNPALGWMVKNAAAFTDGDGRVKLQKKSSNEKIDGAYALVNAVAAKLASGEDGPSVYDKRGVLVL